MSNINELKPTISLNPFARFCCTIGNLPSSYMSSLTYEEQLLWFCDYLQNTVIPAVNNNAEVVKELQELYVKLKNYVDNYFNNLDVQNEINNKLDEMVIDGTLEQIIGKFISENYTFSYSTLQELKNDKNLQNGNRCLTFGYYKKGDGGKAEYIISDDNSLIPNDGSIVALNNGLFAVLIFPNESLNIRMFGAKGDGINDDSIAFNNAINYVKSFINTNDYSQRNTIFIPFGNYRIDNTIFLSTLVKLKTTGYATFESHVADVCFKLIPEEISNANSPFERNNYLFGNIINGENGFRVINALSTRGNTIAFDLGNNTISDTTKQYNISKTIFKNITINNFDTGIRINPFDFYINTFDNIYMEQNNYCVQIGINNILNYKNSGEKIRWVNCTFSGFNIAFQYNTGLQPIDFYFECCSFDYGNCIFYSPNNDESKSVPRIISLINCHIEEISYNVTSNDQPHGILYGTFRAYQITIANSRILQTNLYNLFYSNQLTSYTLNLISCFISTYSNKIDFKDPSYPFMANENITNINIINNSSSLKTGINSRLSSFNNLVFRGDFRQLDSGSKYETVPSSSNGVIIGDFKQEYWNKIAKDLLIDTESPLNNGKSLRITVDTSRNWDSSTANQGSSLNISSRIRNCSPGDIFEANALIKNIKGKNTLSITAYFYDEDNNLIKSILQTTPISNKNEWSIIEMPRYFKAPSGSNYFKILYTFNIQTLNELVDGTQAWIGGLFIEKIN